MCRTGDRVQGSVHARETLGYVLVSHGVGGLLLFLESLSKHRRLACPERKTSGRLPLNSSYNRAPGLLGLSCLTDCL